MCNPIAAEVCSGQYTRPSPIAYLAEKSKGYAGNLVIPAVKTRWSYGG